MNNVTDEVSNPFGMRPPCPHHCPQNPERNAVFGYGDANADFHVIGDHPGVHGGEKTGIPFTDSESASKVIDVLLETGFVHDKTRETPILTNCFLSYLYLCCVPEDESPCADQYLEFEPFFDAELRAIAADVLLPVGERVTRHVINEYSSKSIRPDLDMHSLHAHQIRGRGFLIIPLLDPTDWNNDDYDQLTSTIETVLSIDYHQMVDLSRFLPGNEPYYVR